MLDEGTNSHPEDKNVVFAAVLWRGLTPDIKAEISKNVSRRFLTDHDFLKMSQIQHFFCGDSLFKRLSHLGRG